MPIPSFLPDRRIAMALICLMIGGSAFAAQPPVPGAAATAVSATAVSTAATSTPVVEHRFANGLRLLIREDHRAPTVVHMVLYQAGSIDEFNGTTGIAHVLEHMMFKGTPRHPAGEFSQRIARLGGRENAFTSRDYTGYYQQVPVSALGEAIELESDRMAHLSLTQEQFAQEIKVVMEERRWRTEDSAAGRMYEQLMATAFIASPQRFPTVGWADDLEHLTVEDARHWYRQWYAPNNAVVVVVGDVIAADVIRQVERSYGRLPRKELPRRRPQLEPAQAGLKRIWVKAPAENPSVLMAFKVPKLVTVDGDREPYALEVLSAVLDADENGRLTRELVRGSRVANQAGASYGMMLRGSALFMLSGTPAQGHTTDEVEQALRAQIARIASDGVREEELKRVKTQYVAGQIYQRDSVMSQAREMGALAMLGFEQSASDRTLELIRTVTAEEVQAVARKYFGDDALTVATLVPQPIGQRRAPPAGLRH